MDAQFWLDRWQHGDTATLGFHQTRVTPLLAKYWPQLEVPAGSRVLVPLCGKTLDMVWLAEQGYQVLGVELSPVAVAQFFDEQKLTPSVSTSALGQHWCAGAIEILCGDIFALDAGTLAACAAAFDRAALVALPADMRARYAQHVYGNLSPSSPTLLLTIDYDQAQMSGPPFSVDDAEIQRIFAPHTHATLIDRRDIRSKDARADTYALARLDTLVYRLERA